MKLAAGLRGNLRAGLLLRATWEAGGTYVPSLASSKQCFGSQWLVKMTTLWPLF